MNSLASERKKTGRAVSLRDDPNRIEKTTAVTRTNDNLEELLKLLCNLCVLCGRFLTVLTTEARAHGGLRDPQSCVTR